MLLCSRTCGLFDLLRHLAAQASFTVTSTQRVDLSGLGAVELELHPESQACELCHTFGACVPGPTVHATSVQCIHSHPSAPRAADAQSAAKKPGTNSPLLTE